MTEQIGSEHAVAAEPSARELGRVTPVARDTVEIDDSRRALLTPRLDVERPAHHQASSTSSVSETISVRRPSLTSDQITVPSLSIRNVPRRGAPVSSSKTP